MGHTAQRILVSVVASVGLVACAQESSPPGGVASANCTPNACTIVVKVTGNCSAASDITLDPDTMPVPKENHQVKMHWDLQTSNFKIAQEPDGITFTTPPLPPPGEFHSPNLAANGTKYNLTNANSATVPTQYKYNIQLLRADGTKCARKDPFIRNGA